MHVSGLNFGYSDQDGASPVRRFIPYKALCDPQQSNLLLQYRQLSRHMQDDQDSLTKSQVCCRNYESRYLSTTKPSFHPIGSYGRDRKSRAGHLAGQPRQQGGTEACYLCLSLSTQ